MPAKNRPLQILTRKEGIREENPLFKLNDKYYPNSSIRTPALRDEADALQEEETPKKRKLGMQIKSNYLKARGYDGR